MILLITFDVFCKSLYDTVDCNVGVIVCVYVNFYVIVGVVICVDVIVNVYVIINVFDSVYSAAVDWETDRR